MATGVTMLLVACRRTRNVLDQPLLSRRQQHPFLGLLAVNCFPR